MSEERDLLAAEYALRLLEGAEHEEARRRAARDPDFAAAVAEWEERFQPLADEAGSVAPGAGVWAQVERRIAAAAPLPSSSRTPSNDDQAELKRKLRRWQVVAVGASAIAASFATVAFTGLLREPPIASDPAPVTPNTRPARPGELLVASLAGQSAPNAASITYHVPSSSLLVMPVLWPHDPAHDHVLWIIPPGGEPVLVGSCCQSGPERHSIPRELAPHFRARSAIAVSVEPRGGPPGGRPSSPFVVRSELRPI